MDDQRGRTAVAVLTTGRAGSSAVCRVLSRCGVDFGPPFVAGEGRPANPRGTYEDKRLARLVDNPGRHPYGLAVSYAKERGAEADDRGVRYLGAKYPGLSARWPMVRAALADHAGVTGFRVVFQSRGLDSAVASYQTAFGHSAGTARAIVEGHRAALAVTRRAHADPSLDLDLSEWVADPVGTTRRLVAFVFGPGRWEALGERGRRRVVEAFEPSLVRHGGV